MWSLLHPQYTVCLCLLQVRLPLLPVEFLTGTVAKDEMIKGNLSCRDLMDEARNYHLHLSNEVVPDFEYSIRTIPRKHTAGSTYMVVNGFEYVTTDFMASIGTFSTSYYHRCSYFVIGSV